MPIAFKCPHCSGGVVVEDSEINCGIFRHAVFRADYQQINPHMPKVECDRLVAEGLVYGCGKPFRVRPVTKEEADTCSADALGRRECCEESTVDGSIAPAADRQTYVIEICEYI